MVCLTPRPPPSAGGRAGGRAVCVCVGGRAPRALAPIRPPPLLRQAWQGCKSYNIIKWKVCEKRGPKRLPNACQARVKRVPSYCQASTFLCQAMFSRKSNYMCFLHFLPYEVPPKYPYYNIKKGTRVQKQCWNDNRTISCLEFYKEVVSSLSSSRILPDACFQVIIF